jgi:hypothetical protein
MTTNTTGPELVHVIGAEGLVSIRVRDGDLRLRAVDGETLHVRDTHGRDLGSMLTIELGAGSASLSERHGSGVSFDARGRHTPELVVELPRRATVVVETVSAEIDVDGLVGDQRYRTTSGDIGLRAASGRLAIEAVSADIDIRATGEAEVAARTVSGDVELRAGTLRSLRLTTTSGDVSVAGRLIGDGPFAVETVSGDARLAPAGDVRIEMATMSGDMRSELRGRIEGSRGHRSLAIGSAGPQVTVRTMSGDLSVVRPVPVLEPAGTEAPPAPPMPPTRPDAPAHPAVVDPAPAAPARNGAIAAAYEDARLAILRSLERGDIDVAEAGRRFEALDGGEPLGDGSATRAPDALDPASDTTRVAVVGSEHA